MSHAETQDLFVRKVGLYVCCSVTEFTTTQEGIDPYFCTGELDRAAGGDLSKK